ncbi:hypothetical protein [Halochromatium salexigens]|uniref:hypothetical protein n=1 Tax=Halochromatium salexigens TaxID=49447 RepID=UPI00191490DE|nr:hypothetical protein [Halochromatium salexigens]
MTTQKISREQVKAEIDQLDSEYLGLAYRVIRQFPRRAEQRQRPGKPTFSRRWLGKLQKPSFSEQAMQENPKLAYLAKRYGL